MRFLLTIVFLVLSFSAHAVVLTIKDCTADRVLVTNQGAGTDCAAFPDRCGQILFSSLRQGSDALKAADLEDRLNVLITQRDSLASQVDTEDPTQVANPGLTFGERFYWCNEDREPLAFDAARDSNTFLCARADVVIVTALPTDTGCPITIRRARDCNADRSFPACAP